MRRSAFAIRRFILACVFVSVFGFPTVVVAQTEIIEYYAVDAVGSIRVVFSPSGAVISRIDYSPFGEQVSASTVVPKAYATLFRDGEAGVDYAEARMYQLRTGRFTSPDPVRGNPDNPQSWNQYIYALNMPLSAIDPSGMQAQGPSSSPCSAENSLANCGGAGLFWDTGGGGGLGFGDGYSTALKFGYFPGMPSDMWASLSAWSDRLEKALDAHIAEMQARNALAELFAKASLSGYTLEDGTKLSALTPVSEAGISPAKLAVTLTVVANAAAQLMPRAGQAASTWGTRVHAAFKVLGEGLKLPQVDFEVSYLGGKVVEWGTPGSVRFDAILRQGDTVLRVFDLKTGVAGLGPARIEQMYRALRQTPPVEVIRIGR